MILLDHCVPAKYARLLQSWGYDTEVLASQIAPDSPDPDVLQLATKLDAVLLTVDMDFSNILDYPPENFAGIIVIRYQAKQEADSNKILRQALQDLYREGLRGVLVVITAVRYRVRK